MTSWEQSLLCQQVRRVMGLPLDYVPNDQFEAWSLDRDAENEVLAPMPTCNRPIGRPRPSSHLAPWVVGFYEVPPLTRQQEVHLFRKMNYLKYKAAALRGKLDLSQPEKSLLDRIELFYNVIVATKHQIICANLRRVFLIAERYVRPPYDLFEMLSEGHVWLMQAVERFDYSRGQRFSTHVSQTIIHNFARLFSKTLNQRSRLRMGRSHLVANAVDVHRHPSEWETADSCQEIALDDILRCLDQREQEVIVRRFGLRCGQDPQTLQQVGNLMGLTKERIRQIEARALARLSKAVVQEGFAEAFQ